ncbi:bifunctional tRNA (5-methylaminomethyl-2-thiouridine)(34)-methyltransferase MnmD/FAD-dependent 5-carboxymethylaminomethyl-2-thiouridine(34) oxidoreductase MnmC [Nitrincola schmidtii]|uniref:bifunctional tRNA (5-methylaminomethyl-2-thiouridine)(34)-methyltransferase MnmD/FAD-dependent 5-carboxymethylaminomethyl-2-thiouridine(34) oxidoreductase MnmC n=1 Tax=Nitrincola schmidtii TaxID=1730894 RepID=UPI001456DAAA|nr:bifunctional tRNA (5-methylaminomethyl-2-thiouridine)(34)-methyltransferase MnmD/FAD-dependent 5-carboxymethylaminomethyl-2-thiouridine(34) oxidoreductase MnmC [Nitrincola schmidtii]
MQRIKSATLRWDQGVPISDQFDDFYFNSDGGVDESNHVFIQGNQLVDRFKALTAKESFVIAETGFGTGLNFLITRQHWLKNAPDDAILHFISFEKYPLTADDMALAWQSWPHLNDCNNALLEQYPPAIEGFHSLSFDQGMVKLTLIFGDLLEQLPRLEASIDAWYLDGFSPSKNPAMWQSDLYQHMARLSHSQTTFATFTVSRQVREGLQAAGYSLTKRSGFGQKREMLTGRCLTDKVKKTAKLSTDLPVIIIGAGLAGACTARLLAEQGQSVLVLESNSKAAQEGSGNPQGALYAKLAVKPSPETSLHLHGLLYSKHQIQQLPELDPPLASLCGVLQLALSEKERERQAQLCESNLYPSSLFHAVDPAEASQLSGAETPFSGLFFPDAGWVAPADYCHYLLDHPLIDCRFNQQVVKLEHQDRFWTVTTDNRQYQAEYVVICTAAEARRLTQLDHLPIKPIRGQTSQMNASDDLPTLKTVVCGEGYISPARQQYYCFGATFDLHHHDRECRDSDHEKNINQLTKTLPGFSGTRVEHCSGRTGFRCSTADYLPIVGEAAHYSETIKRFAKLRNDAQSCQQVSIPRLKGLFVNLGHGSKGLITCPISAGVLVAMMFNQPNPLPKDLTERLDPARFILRDLTRRRI